MTQRMRRSRLAISLVLIAAAADCASADQKSAPLSTSGPEIRCRTVLEVRPGALGTASNATPVQKCEPVMPAPPPEEAAKPPAAE
jgi:hypothetical protein